MAAKFDKNGFGGRKAQQKRDADGNEQDGDGVSPMNEKTAEYIKALLSEKLKADENNLPNSMRLLEQELAKVQASGKAIKDNKYADVYRDRPINVRVKVLVPVKEHPKFNFVGNILGPKGNTVKALQEETMCKMAIFGKGSMRDKKEEDNLRNSLDPKFSHLTDELHVEISAMAPPAEAYARMAFALAEVRKYLIPEMSAPPGGEMFGEMGGPRRGPPPLFRGPGGPGGPGGMGGPGGPGGMGRGGPGGPGGPPRAPAMGRGAPRGAPKGKPASILGRARSAMERQNYGGYDDSFEAPQAPRMQVEETYDDYYDTQPPVQHNRDYYRESPNAITTEHNNSYYSQDSYGGSGAVGGSSRPSFKSYRGRGGGGGGGGERRGGGVGRDGKPFRSGPYNRPKN